MAHGARHGRRAGHENRETGSIFLWPDPDGSTEWDRPAAAEKDANRGKALRKPRLMNRIFCHRFLPAASSAGRKKPNRRLNDKPGNLWYSLTERQGRAPSLMTKRPENRLRMDGGIPSGSRRAQQRLSEQRKEFQVRSKAGKTEPAPGRETPVFPTTLTRSGRRRGCRWGFS